MALPKTKRRFTAKEFCGDYLLSLLIELVLLFSMMGFCALFIYKGALIGDEVLVGHEMSSPTVGRLIYMLLSFTLGNALCAAPAIYAKLNPDRDITVCGFWCGYISGIFLWQSFGECAWHFSVGGINFVQLESIQAFPLVVIFILLMTYARIHHSFDWGVWCALVSFACNWLGHYVTVGIYPFVEPYIESRTWNVSAGLTGGTIMFALSILFLVKNIDSRKGRISASLLTYISIGVAALSVLEG